MVAADNDDDDDRVAAAEQKAGDTTAKAPALPVAAAASGLLPVQLPLLPPAQPPLLLPVQLQPHSLGLAGILKGMAAAAVATQPKSAPSGLGPRKPLLTTTGGQPASAIIKSQPAPDAPFGRSPSGPGPPSVGHTG